MMAISCKDTQACGGCPYKNAYDQSGLTGGAVYGMFGADCWYRGKYGNYLLETIGVSDDYNFWGDTDDGTIKSPESCEELADVIADELTENNNKIVVDGEDITNDLKYAEWYLRWVAKEYGGLVAWG